MMLDLYKHHSLPTAASLLLFGALLLPTVTAQACINCYRDCEVGSWTSWSGCSKICGGGTQTRSRKVTQERNNGGKKCPSLEQTRSCNTQGCYSFKLRAATGNEIVYMTEDGEDTKYELEKGWNTLYSSKRKTIVKFINAMYNAYDQSNGNSNAVTGFLWGYNYHVRYTDSQGNSFASVGVAGEGPEYVSSAGGFKCGTAEENSMCQTVRDGKWRWVGSYSIKFPISLTPEPTATPIPAPTPSRNAGSFKAAWSLVRDRVASTLSAGSATTANDKED